MAYEIQAKQQTLMYKLLKHLRALQIYGLQQTFPAFHFSAYQQQYQSEVGVDIFIHLMYFCLPQPRLGAIVCWNKEHLPSLFDNLFQYASCRHTHNTRYASRQNFCKLRPHTNTGKQMFSYQAIDLWRDIPYYLKDLNTFSFAKEIKHYLLSEQYSRKFEQ